MKLISIALISTLASFSLASVIVKPGPGFTAEYLSKFVFIFEPTSSEPITGIDKPYTISVDVGLKPAKTIPK